MIEKKGKVSRNFPFVFLPRRNAPFLKKLSRSLCEETIESNLSNLSFVFSTLLGGEKEEREVGEDEFHRSTNAVSRRFSRFRIIVEERGEMKRFDVIFLAKYGNGLISFDWRGKITNKRFDFFFFPPLFRKYNETCVILVIIVSEK